MFPPHLMANYVIVREIYELFAIAAVVVVTAFIPNIWTDRPKQMV